MALHGEYKSPGGKLVVVDLNVEGGRLSKVEVSGDFFLEPPEALADIVSAIEGAAADSEEESLAKLIRDGLREGAELIGFDPESVAVAVRRAVTDGSPRERA
jgi:lipoate-protein ligase A